MAINIRIAAIKDLLIMIEKYNDLIVANSFEEATIDDMQQNAKDTCNSAKSEIDGIKGEIDEWS